jgi:hypothetical protein
MTVLEWVVIGLAWICALDFLVAVVLLGLYLLREPPGWWVRRRIPDFIPDDWTGGDRKADLSAKRTVRGDGPRNRR